LYLQIEESKGRGGESLCRSASSILEGGRDSQVLGEVSANFRVRCNASL